MTEQLPMLDNPIDVDLIRDAAIDGGDYRMAALAILANPASADLPLVVTERLGALVFGAQVSEVDKRKIVSVANYLDGVRVHV